MPLYEYRCQSCNRVVEVLQKHSDRPLRKCEHCGGRLQKLVSPSGFVFKGGGWYVTDYKSSPSSNESRAEKESKSDQSGSKDKPGKSESAPEKKTDKSLAAAASK